MKSLTMRTPASRMNQGVAIAPELVSNSNNDNNTYSGIDTGMGSAFKKGNSALRFGSSESRHDVMDIVDNVDSNWETVIKSYSTITKHGINLLILQLKDPLPHLGNQDRPVSVLNLKDYCGLWNIQSISFDRKQICCVITGEFPPKRKWEMKRVLCDGEGSIYNARTGMLVSTNNDDWFTSESDNVDTISANDSKNAIASEESRFEHYTICRYQQDPEMPAMLQLAPFLNFHVRSTIFSITAVDTVNQTFDADVFCEFRLQSISMCPMKNEAEEALAIYGICSEMFQIENGGGETQRWETFEPNPRMLGSFSYIYCFRTKGTFFEEFELENFPFDIQNLTITTALTKSCAMARFTINYEYPSIYRLENFMLNNIYVVVFRELVMATMDYSDSDHSASSYIYPHVSYTVLFMRKPFYYFSNVAYPVFILSILAFLSMGLEVDGTKISVGDRLGIILTLLLTAVAYKFVVASSLPQVSYLTILDKYVLLCFGYLIFVALATTIFPYVEYRFQSRVLFVVEFYINLGVLVIFIIANGLLKKYLMTWMHERYSRKFKMIIIEITRRVVAAIFKKKSADEQLSVVSASLHQHGIGLHESYGYRNTAGARDGEVRRNVRTQLSDNYPPLDLSCASPNELAKVGSIVDEAASRHLVDGMEFIRLPSKFKKMIENNSEDRLLPPKEKYQT